MIFAQKGFLNEGFSQRTVENEMEFGGGVQQAARIVCFHICILPGYYVFQLPDLIRRMAGHKQAHDLSFHADAPKALLFINRLHGSFSHGPDFFRLSPPLFCDGSYCTSSRKGTREGAICGGLENAGQVISSYAGMKGTICSSEVRVQFYMWITRWNVWKSGPIRANGKFVAGTIAEM